AAATRRNHASRVTAMFDLLLRGANVATMQEGQPFGLVPNGAIGIAEGKVAWIGPDTEAPASDVREVWELGGKVVTPGLVDPHTHIVYGEEGLIDFEILSG